MDKPSVSRTLTVSTEGFIAIANPPRCTNRTYPNPCYNTHTYGQTTSFCCIWIQPHLKASDLAERNVICLRLVESFRDLQVVTDSDIGSRQLSQYCGACMSALIGGQPAGACMPPPPRRARSQSNVSTVTSL